MIILAFDTTSAHASVAIRRDGQTVFQLTLESQDGFAHLIFPVIRQALDRAEVRLVEIDCFAAANGPGSFTGVRVGLTAMKGLAAALNKPAAGISNLRALASFGNAPLRAPVIDARRGEIYAAIYDDQLNLVLPETVLTLEKWLAALPDGCEFVSQSALEMAFTQAPLSLAAAVARCAELDGPDGWRDPALLDANYVRRSDAELFWHDAK